MKNLAEYSTPDMIGSIHWFRTLAGQLLHMSEYISMQQNGCDDEIYERIIKYAKIINNISLDLVEWEQEAQPSVLLDYIRSRGNSHDFIKQVMGTFEHDHLFEADRRVYYDNIRSLRRILIHEPGKAF